MRRGNIIAGILLVPGFSAWTLIFANIVPRGLGVSGWFLFFFLVSTLVFGTALLYLIVSNAFQLQNLTAFQAIYPYVKMLRIIVLILIFVVVISMALAPKKRDPRVGEARVSLYSLQL